MKRSLYIYNIDIIYVFEKFCSVRKYITDDGHVRFDVGCTDTQVRNTVTCKLI